MNTPQTSRARALMGLGALSSDARQELDIARGRIWDKLAEATGLLRNSQTAADDTASFENRVAQLRDDIDATYIMIDQNSAANFVEVSAEVRGLEARADRMLAEARALVGQRESAYSRNYAIALGFAALAMLLGAVTITSKGR